MSPEVLYHYTSLTQPITLTPRGFVRGLPEFALAQHALGGQVRKAAIVASQTDPVQQLLMPKVWAELAYEAQRRHLDPNLVSRLDAVFAFVNPLDAFEALATWDATGSDRTVWACQVPGGAVVSFVDVDQFRSVPRDAHLGGSPAWWEAVWNDHLERAVAYWQPGQDGTLEALVHPALSMTRRVHLRSFIQTRGPVGSPRVE